MWFSNTQFSNTQRKARKFTARKSWTIAILLLWCVTGCGSFDGSQGSSGIQPVGFAIATSTIESLKQAPNVNAIVQIKGQVGQRVPLLGKTAYELSDATGSIWVIATDAIPNPGDGVVVEGKLLYQSIPLNGKEQGSVYLEQQRQLQHTSAVKSDRGTSNAES
ncbi:MAG: hypothetical protein KME27_25965 [Lyngbya sp. HA4199-MV5]|jgi:uncharacterized protein YdeI (BOF family)|nr:hypothetical protein [Lyngbya sp. HA4199-MV5]